MQELFAADVRILGMRLRRKPLSDAEYVERIRRQLRMSRWLRHFLALGGIGLAVLMISLVQVFFQRLDAGGGAAGQQNLEKVIFGTAVALGVSMGFSFGHWMHSVGTLFFGQRQEKLLVACWDALSESLAERDSRSFLDSPSTTPIESQ